MKSLLHKANEKLAELSNSELAVTSGGGPNPFRQPVEPWETIVKTETGYEIVEDFDH